MTLTELMFIVSVCVSTGFPEESRSRMSEYVLIEPVAPLISTVAVASEIEETTDCGPDTRT